MRASDLTAVLLRHHGELGREEAGGGGQQKTWGGGQEESQNSDRKSESMKMLLRSWKISLLQLQFINGDANNGLGFS